MKNTRAFTLIELLVVIAIIAILATLAIVSLQNARSSARDTKRIADLKQMQTALELYFNENNSYPTEEEFVIGSPLISSSTGKILMNSIPTPPTTIDGDCSESRYNYTSSEDSYRLSSCIGKDQNNLSAGVIIATPSSLGDACANQVQFTDTRDGATYNIVAIEEQCWMADNLNYGNECISKVWMDFTDVGWCGCYNNDLANCDTYGKLYQWSAAMAGSSEEGAQGACPNGWHLPTDEEIKTLEGAVDSTYAIGSPEWDGTSWRGDDAGFNIKTSSGGGNNSSGFELLLSGSRVNSGFFINLGTRTYLWSSSFSLSSAWSRNLHSSFSSIRRNNGHSPDYAMSVRCLKN